MSPLSNDWRSSNQLLERCTWWSCRLWSCLTLTPVTAAGAARRSDTDIQRQNRTSFILYSSFIWKKNKNVMRNQCPASPTLKLNTFGLVWGQRWRQFYCHKLKERKVLTVVYSETFLHFTSKKNKKNPHDVKATQTHTWKLSPGPGLQPVSCRATEKHTEVTGSRPKPHLYCTQSTLQQFIGGRWRLTHTETTKQHKKKKKKKKSFRFLLFCRQCGVLAPPSGWDLWWRL